MFPLEKVQTARSLLSSVLLVVTSASSIQRVPQYSGSRNTAPFQRAPGPEHWQTTCPFSDHAQTFGALPEDAVWAPSSGIPPRVGEFTRGRFQDARIRAEEDRPSRARMQKRRFEGPVLKRVGFFKEVRPLGFRSDLFSWRRPAPRMTGSRMAGSGFHFSVWRLFVCLLFFSLPFIF
ncbi:hypothetical protein M885DRAFT_32532 [Pelagophyceae sp. CCMP2097]|nr:hypothetical protein M885DRAFT_32532 [Pelagophyceae sp. CCMP2097]|eukprot:CAMPEP_0184239104 /NCGR_PEP_ID=MMETSP0976-20121227/27213_1 /TAXON_ID=483370 /ORGANISM="non described non described, Strain CCMP2097" /LENGTH=176 /DNA_ID=CAMNT_0026544309 /DNA_START=422 /DNA_END=952 /DNA_ORIENTATION=-